MIGKLVACLMVVCFLGLLLCGCVTTQKYNDLLAEREALSLDKDKLATQNEDLLAQVAGLEKERDALADEVVLLKEDLKSAETKGTTTQAEVSSLRTLLADKDNQIEVLTARVEQLNKDIAALKRENEGLKSKGGPSPEMDTTPAPGPETM